MTWAEYLKSPDVVLCVRDTRGLIVALCVGSSDEELKELLERHPGWYLSYLKINES